MVTTRSKDKVSKAAGMGDAAPGSKREAPRKPNEEPPSKHRKHSSEETKNQEPEVRREEPEMKPAKTETGDGGSPRSKEKETKRAKPKSDTGTKDGQNAAPGTETATVQEKGLIYFFSRPRVSIKDPKSVSDIARSFFVLRPADGDKKPPEDGPSRLCIIPKKVLPTSGRQRWIGFVEKAGEPWYKATGVDLEGKDYETKTAGHKHIPDSIFVGEGIYALTKSGRAANLVYMLTEPKELGEVQRDLGLKDKGYFTISTRNPVYPAPKGMGISGNPGYPPEIMNDFQSLRWIPTQPRHLDHPNTQFLLIGHTSGIDEAFKPDTKGAAKEKMPTEDEVTIKEEPIEGEEDLIYDIREDEVVDVLLDLEKYAHEMTEARTEF